MAAMVFFLHKFHLVMYITYDIKQGTAPGQPILRSVKQFDVPHNMRDWEVGQFTEQATGRLIFGVRIRFHDLTEHLIALPENAENVQLRSGKLPSEYEETLRKAVA